MKVNGDLTKNITTIGISHLITPADKNQDQFYNSHFQNTKLLITVAGICCKRKKHKDN